MLFCYIPVACPPAALHIGEEERREEEEDAVTVRLLGLGLRVEFGGGVDHLWVCNRLVHHQGEGAGPLW